MEVRCPAGIAYLTAFQVQVNVLKRCSRDSTLFLKRVKNGNTIVSIFIYKIIIKSIRYPFNSSNINMSNVSSVINRKY